MKSSNKNFGIVFFLFFLILSLFPLISGKDINLILLVLSFLFLILGLLNSKLLSPLNYFWIKFGEIIGKFLAPVIMFLIYFTVVFVTSIILKVLKKDILDLKINKSSKTFWRKKNNHSNMSKQF